MAHFPTKIENFVNRWNSLLFFIANFEIVKSKTATNHPLKANYFQTQTSYFAIL
jgi:hypothetical protein